MKRRDGEDVISPGPGGLGEAVGREAEAGGCPSCRKTWPALQGSVLCVTGEITVFSKPVHCKERRASWGSLRFQGGTMDALHLISFMSILTQLNN